MPKPKTKVTEISVDAFLDSVQPDRRADEGRALDMLFRRATGWEPRMWGASIVGYGRYRYAYASGHGGEACAAGFSPRKAELVVYAMGETGDFAPLLARLGKHKLGKSCIHIKSLEDVDLDVLEEIVRQAVSELEQRWPVSAG